MKIEIKINKKVKEMEKVKPNINLKKLKVELKCAKFNENKLACVNF